jgi:predicted dehydrogenase
MTHIIHQFKKKKEKIFYGSPISCFLFALFVAFVSTMIFFRLVKATLLSFLSSGNSFDDTDKPPLNVALIGAGILATGSHAPVLQQLSQNFNCVAVWSRNFDNAQNLATKLGAAPTTDLEQIWNSPEIDAVIMATPIDVQSDMVLQALQAGKHILSEKPVAINMEKAQALVEEYEAAFDQRLVWNVAGNFRYQPAIRFAKKALSEIGKPFLVSLRVRAPYLKSSPFSEAMWRNNPSWYGGMIVEAFVHASSMLRGLFGTPISVSAHTSSRTKHIPSIDTMTAQVTWADDIQGTVSLTYASTQHEFELEVIGSEGRMVLSRDEKGAGYRLFVENSGTRYHQDIPFGGLEGEMLAFSDSIQYAAPRFNTPRDALSDLELVEACLESGKLNGSKILLSPTSLDKEPAVVDHLNRNDAQEMGTNKKRQYAHRQTHGSRAVQSPTRGAKWHGKELLS